MSQIEPRRAPVRPRVMSREGEALLLEDLLPEVLSRVESGAICIQGPPGWGKSTTLEHLSVVLPRGSMVTLLDEPPEMLVREMSQETIVVYTAPRSFPLVRHAARFWLKAWDVDECLEYLMARDPGACGSVLPRIGSAVNGDLLPCPPGTATAVMDEMIQDPSLEDWRSLILRRLDAGLSRKERIRAGHACFYELTATCERVIRGTSPPDPPRDWIWFLVQGGPPPVEAGTLLFHPSVQRVLAAERIVRDLKRGGPVPGLEVHLPPELVGETGAMLKKDPEALMSLVKHLDRWPATAATLLHASDTGWRPESSPSWQLSRAYLPRAIWPEIRLLEATLNKAVLRGSLMHGAVLLQSSFVEADLSGAILSASNLDGADFSNANLSRAALSLVRGVGARFAGADLRGADLEGATLKFSDFREADLRGANLRRAGMIHGDLYEARLGGTDLSGADLSIARLTRSDLRGAVLDGTDFAEANLRGANLAGLEIRGASFERACLEDALLTGSVIHGGRLRKARLRWAKLGEIDWPRADLREAELCDVTFHMGTSRSGLLFDAPPGEGSRTGFYTDEYHEMGFKAPEEIRVANLRGADLRGAKVDRTDFYLVDLRDAQYDAEQEMHFRRCGAILGVRA